MSTVTGSSGAAGTQAVASSSSAGASKSSNTGDDGYAQDQVKVFSHEGDGENTEHLKSMDLHDIKTELERDAEKAEMPKSGSGSATSPFPAEGSTASATTGAAIPPASIRPVLQQSAAMVYANGGVPFMLPPFPAGASSLYPVMRPVKLESDWKVSQAAAAGTAQLNLPTYSYPAGFLPVDQAGIRHAAYPFMLPGQYVTTPMSYPQVGQFAALGGSVAPNATVQPNSGGVLTQQVKEKKPHIKKPLNAFMLFMKQKRADVIKECTLKESAAINQILGKMWHALDRTEQAKYYEMAREERAKHMQMYPGWSARDNYAVHKKRRKRKVKQGGGAASADGKAESADDSRDKDAVVSVPDNLSTTPSATPTSVGVAGQHVLMSTSSPPTNSGTVAMGTGASRTDEEDIDVNSRKCRARFGLDQQHMWCGPCRRKKKCIRYSVGEDDIKDVGCEVGVAEEEEEDDDDILIRHGNGDVVTTASTTSSVLLSNAAERAHHTLPGSKRLMAHEAPVALQTIPT